MCRPSLANVSMMTMLENTTFSHQDINTRINAPKVELPLWRLINDDYRTTFLVYCSMFTLINNRFPQLFLT